MYSALEGFLDLECDRKVAGWLRWAVAEANGRGYDQFDMNLFNVELFHAENRATIAEACALGYEDAELPLSELVDLLPDVPPEEPPRAERRVIVPPPPSE